MNDVKSYIGQADALAAAKEECCIMQTFSWENGTMSEGHPHEVGITVSNGSAVPKRMYLNFNMPTMPCNPRIKKAELKFNVSAINKPEAVVPIIGLFHVTEAIMTGSVSPAFDADPLDYAILQTTGDYIFDVTKIVDMVSKGESTSQNLVLKLMDEDLSSAVLATIGGTSDMIAPSLTITYETNYGVNTSYRAHTHDIGRFGQGSIDLTCGNLMFESLDFAWGGNRMPVTLKHLYNSSLCNHRYTGNSAIKLHAGDFNAMNLGLGWRLNIMQSMVAVSFQHEGTSCNGYVYVGENGEETYFKQSTETQSLDDGTAYNLYETIEDGELFYDPVERTMDLGGHIYLFDEFGRLVKVTDQYGNFMGITYADGKITSVCDGAGRMFAFAYTDALLTSITAPDNTVVSYTYANDVLVGVTYPENIRAIISYGTDNLPENVTLKDAAGNTVYVVCYYFDLKMVQWVEEYGAESTLDEEGNAVVSLAPGKSSFYAYFAESRRTLVKSGLRASTLAAVNAEVNNNYDPMCSTIYMYDEEGNIVSEYTYSSAPATGVSGNGNGIDPYFESGVSTINVSNNLLTHHTFDGIASWAKDDILACTAIDDETQAKYGKRTIRMSFAPTEDIATVTGKGLSQTVSAPARDLTFSAYLRMPQNITDGQAPGVYLRVLDTSGSIITETEHVSVSNGEYFRLDAPFTLSSEQNVTVQILMNGSGSVYVNAPQLETNAFASVYNMLNNGHFNADESASSWIRSNGAEYSTEAKFNMTGSLKVTGNLNSTNGATQDVSVRFAQTTRETFLLSGWAKGPGIANRDRAGLENAKFNLQATVHYVAAANADPDIFEVPFNSAIADWHYVTLQFAKTKFAEVDHVEISCNYDHSYGTVYFDDIQLIREYLETGLTAEDFADPVEEQDVEEEDTADVFEELLDAYGNPLTETIFSENEEDGTMYRAFHYRDGNDLAAEMDNRGYITHYGVDAVTSRNVGVADRGGNVTRYEHDAAGRITKIICDNTSPETTVSYSYDTFDNLTEIVRGDGMRYALHYNSFHNLDTICVNDEGHPIVRYTYKDGNGRLKQVTYDNGDKMKIGYNRMGQMIAERWFDAEDVLTAHYRYSYDNNGNIVRSLDIFAQKEYSYTYEEGRLMRAVECDVTLNGEIVIDRNLVNTILYTYDAEGSLTWKRIIPAVGEETAFCYGSDANGNTTVQCSGNNFDMVSLSQVDSLGRKKREELHINDTVLARQFTYHEGNIPDEHTQNNKVKSAPTTQLVKTITLPDGRTLTYEYDREERITKVTDSLEGVTEYAYDCFGQLRRETRDGVVVNEMSYDWYGNITAKNRVPYFYGTAAWKDMLNQYGNDPIYYDAVGNPTSYRGHTLAWEKGRQLKSFDGNIYAYNANGIRTSKTVGGVKHTYTLDGTKILREAWGNNELIPLYDVEDSVCGIVYDGMPYYFLKNLQGDIIAIVNANGETVARYQYDAWGVCTITGDTSNCNIATINPFRYRGYYFDAEIAMYYLQSRYYDPMVGRFINTDDPEIVTFTNEALASNLYSYCENDAVNNLDIGGCISWSEVKKAIKKIVDNIKNFVQNLVNYIKKQFRSFINKISCHFNHGYVYIPTSPIGYLIDAIITTISGLVKGALLKGGFHLLKLWFKNNKPKLKEFVIETVMPILKNTAQLWDDLLKYIANRFKITSSIVISVSVMGDLVFGKYDFYRWYSAVSSVGGFVAAVLDLLDGKWDDRLAL